MGERRIKRIKQRRRKRFIKNVFTTIGGIAMFYVTVLLWYGLTGV